MYTPVEIVIASVKQKCPGIEQGILDHFASIVVVKEYNKKDIFLEAGKMQKLIGFISSGLVRSFIIDLEGNERTVGFYAEGDYATHYPAFINRQPSQYTIQCLEPTSFVCFSLDDMHELYEAHLPLERYGRLVAEEILTRQQNRIESFVFQTAEERYLAFVEQYPSLFNRISLSHLSSYLGIERQTLTRIRQRLSHH